MINPLLWLELRIRIRERKLWIISLLYLVCLLGMSFIPLVNAARAPFNAPVMPADIGYILLGVIGFTLLAMLVILGPMSSAAAISQEREQRTLASLLNTPLSPMQIAWGKLLATWTFIGWLIALSCPFLFLSTVWCGLSAWQMLLALGIVAAAAAMVSTVALGLSGFFKRTITSYLGTGTALFLWLIVWPILGMMSESLLPNDDPEARAMFEQVLYFVFYSHHPAGPLVVLFSTFMPVGSLPVNPGVAVGVALAEWLAISLFFFAVACRGIRRGLSGKG